jgi:hypothetical protein
LLDCRRLDGDKYWMVFAERAAVKVDWASCHVRRLIQGRAVRVDGEVVGSIERSVADSCALHVGKRLLRVAVDS